MWWPQMHSPNYSSPTANQAIGTWEQETAPIRSCGEPDGCDFPQSLQNSRDSAEYRRG
jgi:hypothetical protein